MGPRENRTIQETIDITTTNPERMGKSMRHIRGPYGLEAPKIRKLVPLKNHIKYFSGLTLYLFGINNE